MTSGISTLDRNVANTYNPFRYRGYYYDVETELYYLQSRYYNPVWGRFINADGYVNANGDILGYNMYAYCGNNPVMNIDSTGEFSKWFAIASVFVAIATVALVVAAAPVAVATAIGVTTTAIQTAATTVATMCTSAAVVSVGAAVIEEIDLAIKEESINQHHSDAYTVYTLLEPETNEVAYVGRTKNYEARMSQHKISPKTKKLIPGTKIDNLTYTQARGLEQIGILTYNSIRLGKNAINGIGSGNPNYSVYMRSAWDYLYNQFTNEFYNLLEG